MTRRTDATLMTALLLASVPAAAQTPPRPADNVRSSVTLPLTEYNRLLDLASRPALPPPPAPVPALLASADLRVRIDGNTAHGVFTLAGEVLRPGMNRVNLISGAVITNATLQGRPLPLTADAGAHAAWLSGPGPFAVTLEWGAPLMFTPGRASVVLPVPPAGTARAVIDLPGEQADVHLSAGIVTSRTVADGRTTVEVTLKPGAQTQVWWSMRDSAPIAAAREVRMLADVLTLVTIGDASVRMAALVDVTVVAGEPRTIELQLPGSYELVTISGSSVDSSEPRDRAVVLTLHDPAPRRHQFLVTLERAHAGGSFRMDSDFIALSGMQRERGEIAIEGVGTLELTAAEESGMHRIDVRELNPALQSLARLPVLSAFRYQRSSANRIALAMDVQRFPDAGVLAAVADRATATTLITSEGRALTEVVLNLRNRAQPFLKVALPSGATIVSVEVAGEGAKPVVGADGTRVPLLRPGFRPSGAYRVAFVFVHDGVPFARKGELQMTLPKMDIPVGLVEWELFVPDAYTITGSDGNVMSRTLLPPALTSVLNGIGPGSGGGTGGGSYAAPPGGRVAGGVSGGVVSGVAEAPPPPPPPAAAPTPFRLTADANTPQLSQNVLDLQRRAAGVLPIKIDVPRVGTSHQFVKPLLVDDVASVKLQYRTRKRRQED